MATRMGSKLENVLDRICNVLQDLHETQRNSTGTGNAIPKRKVHFHSYDETNETMENFIDRLENYLERKEIAEDKEKVGMLLELIPPSVFQTLTNLTVPEKPKAKTYDVLINLLRTHLSPKPNVFAQQHRFAVRIQNESTDCGKSTIETHLRTQFIRGLRDDDIRQELLRLKEDTKFDEIVREATAINTSKIESREIQRSQQTHSEPVNAVKEQRKWKAYGGRQKVNPTSSTETTRFDFTGKCYRCGHEGHRAFRCSMKDKICAKCKKVCHIATVCMQGGNIKTVRQVTQSEDNDDIVEDDQFEMYTIGNIFHMHGVKSGGSGKFMVNIQVEENNCEFELDTGAAVSTMSYRNFLKVCPGLSISDTSSRLRTYSGEIIEPLGTCNITISFGNKVTIGRLFIVGDDVDSICGRQWIRILDLHKRPLNDLEIHEVTVTQANSDELLKSFLKEFGDVFDDKLGRIPAMESNLQMLENTAPKFWRARPVPYALKDRVNAEIDRLEAMGVIEKVVHSQWGTPVVPIVKSDDSIRLCADYKVTLNRFLKDDKYPIPRIEDIFAKMSGGRFFCTHDVSRAYLHMPVDEHSAMLQAISTEKGVYKVNRLMFGVKTAPNIWQRFMDQLLHELDGVACFFDDIIVQESTIEETMQRLRNVLKKLRNNDLHLKKEKCQFFKSNVKYLGHRIDSRGLHPLDDKTTAIRNATTPTNVEELRTFLGLINYYHRFIPDLTTKIKPLNSLLGKEVKFIWSDKCEKAFDMIKKELTSDRVLMHYDPKLPLIVETDASSVGLGAVLSHKMSNGMERPIAFASRTLSKSEQNYSQIDKEATAIFWGINKFFQYCYGRKFVLRTDHKPLVTIFNPDKALPTLSAMRMLNYAIYLSGFNYTIEYRSTHENLNADYFSRFPEPTKIAEDETSIF
ncbi:uncharacterized protein K02A2.6-like [Photinus pyralis]|uniref:uncharacterized protein K02A2.6-like n=1 Tax=Photinus pyralis TaxID=7054 RepID=UPI0012671EC5|nr:uncharacterized protein K02A2.6-like [Photinus pyralis]